MVLLSACLEIRAKSKDMCVMYLIVFPKGFAQSNATVASKAWLRRGGADCDLGKF
jgi:hypothetical protein